MREREDLGISNMISGLLLFVLCINIEQDGVKALGYLAQHQLFDQVEFRFLVLKHQNKSE